MEHDLSFLNPQGERLVGKLLDTGSEDVVVLCHGCGPFLDQFIKSIHPSAGPFQSLTFQ